MPPCMPRKGSTAARSSTPPKKAGLDIEKAKAELGNAARNPNFAQNIKLAQNLEAEGTPLLVVGDQVFYGAVSYETLKSAIDKARKAG